ncbi:MAG: hypothetical protein JWN46_4049 [Acidimicrobiales bacterium]|nr:hypothetical protein [Acidimicrobiales bacterium]
MGVVGDRAQRRLVAAGYLFLVGSAVHIFDHLRRGQGSVTEQLYWAGNLALVVQVVVITLVLTRHRVAPLAAVAAGFPLAIGFAAAHWLPHWSSLSDSFVEGGVSVFSIVASALEIAGALAVGFAGLAVIRARGLASTSSHSSVAGI